MSVLVGLNATTDQLCELFGFLTLAMTSIALPTLKPPPVARSAVEEQSAPSPLTGAVSDEQVVGRAVLAPLFPCAPLGWF